MKQAGELFIFLFWQTEQGRDTFGWGWWRELVSAGFCPIFFVPEDIWMEEAMCPKNSYLAIDIKIYVPVSLKKQVVHMSKVFTLLKTD